MNYWIEQDKQVVLLTQMKEDLLYFVKHTLKRKLFEDAIVIYEIGRGNKEGKIFHVYGQSLVEVKKNESSRSF